ncbi:hypothetical protein E2562_024030 [Oryza meyeriana var. granulata]|uniref:Uncharacterized protein n=1 Tax=Oryza meyeriana var. granulata TaxID=110450 RepID=A0A6G1CRE3_9ORYZ|nr:hypothetical protein E2562_024030 [Oryza meyeriana var. granulata]
MGSDLIAKTESDDEYSATPEHDYEQSDSDPNFEETDEAEDDSNNEAVFDTLKSLCAKLVSLVDYPESPEEMGDPNLDLTLNNITMPCTGKATEDSRLSPEIGYQKKPHPATCHLSPSPRGRRNTSLPSLNHPRELPYLPLGEGSDGPA